MQELLNEILDSIKIRQKGVKRRHFDFKEQKIVVSEVLPERGIGTKAYTLRRIQMLEDKLKELKRDLKTGKYDFKE